MTPSPHVLAYIPSPTVAQIKLGPFPIRFYALCIIAGIALAAWLGERRWRARGGEPHVITDIAIWAVPFGLVGGRLYHVITDYELYFSSGKNWVRLFYIWDGGLGIWGAIALGAVGAWIGARRRGVKLPPIADSLAPGIIFAQALGRWGNWFNNELYGDPTSKPWGLTIHCTDDNRNATPCSGIHGTSTIAGHFQPTFLYESIWDVLIGFLVIWADRRFKMGYGRVFALYVLGYTIGRGWVEHLRSDYAHVIVGLRINDWAAILLGVGALLFLIISSRRHPGREAPEDMYWPHFQPSEPGGAAVDAEGDGDIEADTDGETAVTAKGDAAANGGEPPGEEQSRDEARAAETAPEPAEQDSEAAKP
jgi:prolipoprotein diacylglyceryl transferase